jgi:hypothetical protein
VTGHPRSANWPRRVCTCRSESGDSCPPVCIATSRVAPPATRWPTVHLRRATHGSRNARVREQAPQCAPRVHRLFRVGRQLPACLHRRLSGCPSRHALADRALTPCHTRVEKCENPRTGPAARASRAHGCCSKSDDSCAPVPVAASRVSPLHHARANFLPRGRRPRNSRVRHRHRRSLHRSLTPWVAARSAPHPSPPHALGPEHARHEHRMRRVRCTCMRP